MEIFCQQGSVECLHARRLASRSTVYIEFAEPQAASAALVVQPSHWVGHVDVGRGRHAQLMAGPSQVDAAGIR